MKVDIFEPRQYLISEIPVSSNIFLHVVEDALQPENQVFPDHVK